MGVSFIANSILFNFVFDTRTAGVRDGRYSKASGRLEVAPTEAAFEAFIQRHGQLKPGQFHTIVKDWVDGAWVARPSEGIENLKKWTGDLREHS